MALTLTMTFGLMGLAIDLGLGEFKKHAEQAAANSAAMAAMAYATANGNTCSNGITCNVLTNCTIPSPVTTPFGAACVYAKANGYTNGGGSGGTQTVTFKANNTSSPVSGNSPNLWVQVTVGDSWNTLFGRFGGVNTLAIKASAVAAVSTTGGGNCIIALGQGGTSFTDSGSGNITTTSCGIYDNGNFSYSGSGNITTQTTQYYGSYSDTGSGRLSPTPTSTTSLVSDPFVNVVSPPPPALVPTPTPQWALRRRCLTPSSSRIPARTRSTREPIAAGSPYQAPATLPSIPEPTLLTARAPAERVSITADPET